MNCKPGDLAIIVRGSFALAQHVGKIVCCSQLDNSRGFPVWRFDPPLIHSDGLEILYIDSGLRPIRYNPGEDEMLRIVGKPTEVVAS